ncbi:hypothetical protein BVRB_015890 isoform A [Beta vulgaris subsp. vulgaris]|uniref:Uncharacterized protein n=2 Tax=Beta vulgaris subsp. vulgaris TaxID=3555 RepID=A0A0J8DV61_BETVV|nr:hypothetical protein BVRB_015890 isoform A [Beta vulgaris subsp. vulgaris]
MSCNVHFRFYGLYATVHQDCCRHQMQGWNSSGRREAYTIEDDVTGVQSTNPFRSSTLWHGTKSIF